MEGLFLGLPHIIHIGLKTWLPWAILVSDWLKFNESSPLKLGGTMNCYFVGTDRNETSNLYRCFLPSFGSFDQAVSEEKIQMWKVSRQWTTDTKNSHDLCPGELLISDRTSHRLLLIICLCTSQLCVI
jgi:hypothetical protein